MGGKTAAMDPPPNAPRSPNGRDFAARAEGERMVLKNTPMGRAPQVKREMREEDASSGGGPATATRSGQAKRAARAADGGAASPPPDTARAPLAAPPSAARAPPARGTAMLRGAAVDIKYRPPRKAPVGGKWTEEEDRRLREIVETFGAKNWKRLAMLLGTVRSDVQCLHRWNKVLRPGLSKGPWAAVWKPTGESASQTQLRRRRRVDGVKRLEFEIHTGGRRPRTASSATWCCATARGTSSGA